MLTGIAALENTDWSRLHHAHGRATDTPNHLRALLHEDLESRKKALSHLWSSIIHQGTPWTATAPAALVVAGLLADNRIDRGDPDRANLLSFLVSVAEAPEQTGCSVEELERMAEFDIDPYLDSGDAEALYGDDDAASSFYARAVLGCIRIAPVLMKVMLEELGNADRRVREWAANGAATLAKIESMRHCAKDFEPRLMALARAAENTDERSTYVLSLAELGFSPVAFLDDPSPAVRMCAALAPSLADNVAALNELLDAVEHHAADIDGWFVERPPQFGMRPRFPVVSRLVRHAVAGVTEQFCVDLDWGPLLAAAFQDGSGVIKTDAQRRYLAALVERKDLWDPTFGNPLKWFKQAGLPYDRKACAKRVAKA